MKGNYLKGDAVPRDNLNFACDSSGEAHPIEKTPPMLTATLLQRAEQAAKGIQGAKAKGPQGGQVKGETGDLSVDLPYGATKLLGWKGVSAVGPWQEPWLMLLCAIMR